MTDYTKTTNFAAKDSLPSGNANKIVKGTEIDTEFNNIATASATKANIASPTFTGTVTIPTADINGGAVDATTIGASSASSIVGTTIVANTSINIAGDGATVTGIKDEDDMSSNSATKLATQQSIKAYVDSQVTAQDLDVTDGSSSIDIDLDSESLGILGGTGLSSTASGTSVTLAIDSTVATLTGSQTLTNKTLTAPTLTGTAVVASLDISGDVDVDGTLETDALSINGTTVTSTAAELNILDGVTSTAAELNILDGKAFLDEDNMASNSATGIASQQSIKAYVDSQVTAQDLDVTDGSTSIDIDLDSESLGILGGTGIDSAASGTGVTLSIDSTVATLTGSQTLTNKTLTAPTLTGTAVVASLDISGDVDVDGTLETDALSINGTTVTSTAAELNILDGVTSTAAELNILDGVTATTAELNYVDGVTSAIQTQIDAKAPIANPTFTGSFTSPGIDDNADAIAITIDSSENVGIGTGSAGTFRTKIKHSAASVTTGLGIEASANDSVLRIFHSGSLAGFNATYSSTGAYVPMVFNVGAGGEAMRIDTSGKLNIGGSIMSELLNVQTASSSATAMIEFRNTQSGTQIGMPANENALIIKTADAERMRITASGAVQLSAGGFFYADYIRATSDTNTGINMTGSDIIGFQTAGSERMRIDGSGNVGIGTDNPSDALHIYRATGDCALVLETGQDSGAAEPNIYLKGYATNSEPTIYFGDRFGYPGLIKYDNVDDHMHFSTNGSERMRINSNGKVEVIASGQTYVHHINNGTYSWLTGTDGNNYNFYSAEGTLRGKLTVAGVFTDTSDQAYKKDIKDIGYGLAEVKQLQPRAYKMEVNDEDQLGFIAQEMEQVIPEVVSGEEGSKGLAYGHLVPVLVKAMQEQQTLIESLTDRIAQLENN